jgi:lipopolysaccharide transport system ATP-binding protein
MSQLALKLENVSKIYRLGEVGTGTLAHDLNRWWAKVRGKEDPTLAVVGVNDREVIGGDYAWALRDINLEVEQGEILGIIGRNGAGKSTLLKLLSRVTAPTEGRIRINGKIASLLEVGTGFHPELTGKENIYLNGAILGMTRLEVDKKFDEIVDFSGCQKYIDTPVKRYSSGMYVRLAFAVAAHLEPDILVVDEVLAVGDAEFQSKCIGKLKDVSYQSGRTVLFVSHNIPSIKKLCPSSLLLEKGCVEAIGPTNIIVDRYLSSGQVAERFLQWDDDDSPQSREMKLESVKVVDDQGRSNASLVSGHSMAIEINYQLLIDTKNLRIVITVQNGEGVDVFSTSDYLYQPENKLRKRGKCQSVCYIPGNFLTLDDYSVHVDFEIPMERSLIATQVLGFSIEELTLNQLGRTIAAKPLGVVHPELKWDVIST